jgi:hypothetical protein
MQVEQNAIRCLVASPRGQGATQVLLRTNGSRKAQSQLVNAITDFLQVARR